MLPLVRHLLTQPSCPRCPHDETVTYLNAIGESTTAKFSFQMFQFVGYPEVFLHCLVRLCLPDSPEPCAKVSSPGGLHHALAGQGDLPFPYPAVWRRGSALVLGASAQ